MPTALITGGTHGLGLAAAGRLKKAGFTVAAAARRRPENFEYDFIEADFSLPGAAEKVAAEVERRYGSLDLLLNNAGIGVYAAWEELKEEDLRKLFEVDFFAPVDLTRKLLPLLRKGTKPVVINISSVAGLIPVACMGPYSAVKAAVRMFSESLRIELAGEGIDVVTVCPGRIDTGFSRRALGGREVPETPGRKSVSLEAYGEFICRVWRSRPNRAVFPYWYCFAVWFITRFPGFYGKMSRKVWKLK